MWLTRLALRNPVLILMMSLMTLALGFVSLSNLSVDLFPDITVPLIRVAVFYTGAGPVAVWRKPGSSHPATVIDEVAAAADVALTGSAD